MEQRRTSTRSRTLLEGWVLLNNRSSRIECTVRDISDAGARLVFSEPVQVPQEFELQIPKKKLSSHARIMWSDGQTHGVRFVEAPGATIDARLPEAVASGTAADVRNVLDEAQARVAQLVGMPVGRIRLKLEIDH